MSYKISLQEIPTNLSYEGYLWWSDQQEPEVFRNEELKSNDHELWPLEKSNPFILEGNLWDKKSEVSYLIRYIDGQYLVYKFELKSIPENQITKIYYFPNRMPEIKELIFKDIWLPQSDLLCAGFDVLKPAFIAFVGFKYQEEKK